MQVPDRHTKRLLISSTLPEKARSVKTSSSRWWLRLRSACANSWDLSISSSQVQTETEGANQLPKEWVQGSEYTARRNEADHSHSYLVSSLRMCGAMPQHSHTPNSPSNVDLFTANSSNLMTVYANNYPACRMRYIRILMVFEARCARQQKNNGAFNRLGAVYLLQIHLYSHSDLFCSAPVIRVLLRLFLPHTVFTPHQPPYSYTNITTAHS